MTWIADRAVLKVFVQDHPGAPRDEVWETTVDNPQFDYQWLFEEAGRLPYASGQHTSSIRTLKVSQHDWGGDAASFEAVLVVGKYLIDEGLSFTLGMAFTELTRRMKQRSRDQQQRPLTKDEAIAYARWKVAAAYELDDAAVLSEASIEECADGSWTIELRGGNATYTATLVVEEGVVLFTRMKVTRLGDQAPGD